MPQFQNESSCKPMHSNENDFDLHDNGLEVETHFHMNGFARRFVLKQRPIAKYGQWFHCAQLEQRGFYMSFFYGKSNISLAVLYYHTYK